MSEKITNFVWYDNLHYICNYISDNIYLFTKQKTISNSKQTSKSVSSDKLFNNAKYE